MSWWQILGYASEALADDAYYKGEINDDHICSRKRKSHRTS